MISIKNNKEGAIRSLKVSGLKKDLVRGIKNIEEINSGSQFCRESSVIRSMMDRGIKVSVKGRLNGARRARADVESQGGVSGNTLCKKHKESSRAIYTK